MNNEQKGHHGPDRGNSTTDFVASSQGWSVRISRDLVPLIISFIMGVLCKSYVEPLKFGTPWSDAAQQSAPAPCPACQGKHTGQDGQQRRTYAPGDTGQLPGANANL